MIVEFLQPDASVLDGVTVLLRAGYYAATLGAAGLGMFGIGFGHRLAPAELVRLKRWVVTAALLGLALSLAALALRVLVLTAGASMIDGPVWTAVLRSRIGDAFWLRAGGLVLLTAFATSWRVGPAIAVVGIVGIVASYAAMGHSMLFRPRQELAALVLVHLTIVAFWIGSLPPLMMIARRAAPGPAAALIGDWSRLALWGVLALIGSGALLIWHLAPQLDLVTGSWWGYGLLAKIALVSLLLGLAAWHKLGLTPALARGEAGAGERLARSIGWEMLLVLLIFWAAAEMVSVHPIDIGHRIQS